MRIIQTFVLFFVLCYDMFFLFNVYDYHASVNSSNGGDNSHRTHYRPLYIFDDLRLILTPKTYVLVFHIATSVLPLVLSVTQVSWFVRSKSITAHKLLGKTCLVSAALSSFPAIPLALTIHDNGAIENTIVLALCFVWVASGWLTYYFAAIKKNMLCHRAWAVRFCVVTHTVPVVSRIIAYFVWAYEGKPKWTPSASSSPTLFPRITWCTLFVLVPLVESCVMLEASHTGSHLDTFVPRHSKTTASDLVEHKNR